MTTSLRSVPSLLLIALVVLLAVTVLPAAGAAGQAEPQPELGALNPAFVEALHDPMIALGLGRLPSPVELSVSGAAAARAARAAYPSAYSLVDQIPSRVTTPVKDQDPYQTCWAFANTAALESTILTQQGQATDLSEDNLSGRSGYWSSRDQRYDLGGYDFMAIAYFARWAGPVTEDADPYDGQPESGEVVKHVQGAVMIPGRASDLDNDLIKQLVTTNGAPERRHVDGHQRRAHGRRDQRLLLSGHARVREPRRRRRGLGRRLPGAELRRHRQEAGRQRRLPRAQQLGRRLGSRRLLLGVLLRQGFRPRLRLRDLRRLHVVFGRGRRRRLLAQLRLGQAGRHRPLGLSGRFADLGGQPVHGRVHTAHHGGELLHAVVGHALRGLGGPRLQDPHTASQGHRLSPRLRHRQARHAARRDQGQAVRGGDQADVARRGSAARHRATGGLRPGGLRAGECPGGPELRRHQALAPARPDEPRRAAPTSASRRSRARQPA